MAMGYRHLRVRRPDNRTRDACVGALVAGYAWILWEISSPTGNQTEWTHDKIAAEPEYEACRKRA
jgi:hypothetical protein